MNILLVDDENSARDRLRRMLQSYSDCVIIGEATNGRDALEKIESLKPDVVFLDIEMPVLSGLEAASAIDVNGPKIVFATAYNQFALDAFDRHAVDYILKPVSKDRLELTVEKLRKFQSKDHSPQALISLESQAEFKKARFAAKSGFNVLIFPFDQISAITAKDQYSEVVQGSKRILIDDHLDHLMPRLNSLRFIRIHRSTIIHLDFLKELRRDGDRKYTALLNDELQSEFPVSRERLDMVKLAVLG